MPVTATPTGQAEVARALGVLLDPPRTAHRPVAVALGLPGAPSVETHTSVLVLQCHPHASVHLGADGMLGGEAGDRVAGYWRALGMSPPADADHLGRLLGLYASLAEVEATGPGRAAQAAGRARRALLWEHLAPWVPVWLGAVVDSQEPWFDRWAALMAAWLRAELSQMQASMPSGTRAPLPVALAEAPSGLDDAPDPLDLAAGLVVPVRSGMVLTRARLATASAAVGAAPRQGGRRFVLQGLLDHDAGGTLRWLAREARCWAGRHQQWAETDVVCGNWWLARAEACAATLEAVSGKPT